MLHEGLKDLRRFLDLRRREWCRGDYYERCRWHSGRSWPSGWSEFCKKYRRIPPENRSIFWKRYSSWNCENCPLLAPLKRLYIQRCKKKWGYCEHDNETGCFYLYKLCPPPEGVVWEATHFKVPHFIERDFARWKRRLFRLLSRG